MANKRNTVAYFKKQVDATTAIAPASATDGYVSIEPPDVTTGERELLESELLSGTIGVKKPQLGFETASFSVTTEARSHGNASTPTEPDFGALYESGIGTPHITVADAVGGTPTTTSFDVTTIASFQVGDMLIIDNATDGRVVRFITDISGDTITVNTAMANAPTALDVVSATVNYFPINEAHEFLTGGFYQGNSATDGYFEQVVGALVSGIGLSVEAGAIAKIAFEAQGIAGARTATTASPYTPDYEDVQGLVGFNVEVYFGDTRVCGNKVELNVENELADKKSFCESNGKSGVIIRKRSISGNVNPYTDGSVDYYNALNALTDYSVMIVIGARDAGGFIVGKTMAIYLPQTMITQAKTGDVDDNIIEDINFSAHTGSAGNELDIVWSFG